MVFIEFCIMVEGISGMSNKIVLFSSFTVGMPYRDFKGSCDIFHS